MTPSDFLMTLPNDYARCNGRISGFLPDWTPVLMEPCRDCLRKTNPLSAGAWASVSLGGAVFIQTPEFEKSCPYRIPQP